MAFGASRPAEAREPHRASNPLEAGGGWRAGQEPQLECVLPCATSAPYQAPSSRQPALPDPFLPAGPCTTLPILACGKAFLWGTGMGTAGDSLDGTSGPWDAQWLIGTCWFSQVSFGRTRREEALKASGTCVSSPPRAAAPGRVVAAEPLADIHCRHLRSCGPHLWSQPS